MIKKDVHKFADGSTKTQVRVIQAYRPYPGASPKHRTVKSFGYLEDQPDVDAFWQEVKAFNDELPNLKEQAVNVPISDRINLAQRHARNYGYRFLDAGFGALEIRGLFGKTAPEGPYRYLTVDQVLYPGGVRDSLQRFPFYYGADQYGIDSKKFYPGIGAYAPSCGRLQASLASVADRAGFSSLPEFLCTSAEPVSAAGGNSAPVLSLGLCCSDDLRPICPIPLTEDAAANRTVLNATRDAFDLDHITVVARADRPDFPGLQVLQDGQDGYVLVRGLECEAEDRKDSVHPEAEGHTWEWVDESDPLHSLFPGFNGQILVTGGHDNEQNPVQPMAICTSGTSGDPEQLLSAVAMHSRLDGAFREINPGYTAKVPYLNDSKRITGYFMVMETGLAIVRLIQHAMGEDRKAFSRLQRALRAANCLVIEKGGHVILLDMADVPGAAEDYGKIQECFGTDFYFAISKQESFARFFRDMKLDISK